MFLPGVLTRWWKLAMKLYRLRMMRHIHQKNFEISLLVLTQLFRCSLTRSRKKFFKPALLEYSKSSPTLLLATTMSMLHQRIVLVFLSVIPRVFWIKPPQTSRFYLSWRVDVKLLVPKPIYAMGHGRGGVFLITSLTIFTMPHWVSLAMVELVKKWHAAPRDSA